jgi:hypothetical protein
MSSERYEKVKVWLLSRMIFPARVISISLSIEKNYMKTANIRVKAYQFKYNVKDDQIIR